MKAKLPFLRLSVICLAIFFSVSKVFAQYPPSPPILTATKGTYSNKVNISWNYDANVDSYAVFKSDNGGSSYYTFISYITTTTVDDTNVSPVITPPSITSTTDSLDSQINVTYGGTPSVTRKDYYYWVRAYNQYGWSDSVNRYGYVSTNTIASNSVTIYCSASSGSGYSSVASGQSNSGTYNHTGLPDGVTRYYRLTIQTNGGFTSLTGDSSPVSGETLPAPSTPTGFQCDNSSSWGNSPQFSWNTSSGATSYIIHRKKNSGSFSYLGSTSSTSYTDNFVTLSQLGDPDTYYYKVKASNSVGESAFTSAVSITGEGIEKKAKEFDALTPDEFGLAQNYPNPFNPMTEIKYQIPITSTVRIVIYNALGQEVARLVDREMSAGIHRVRWDARNMTSGTYFCRITAGNYRQTIRMLLIK